METSADVNNKSQKRDSSSIPSGWSKVVRQRKAGKTAGKLDVYIIRWFSCNCVFNSIGVGIR